MKGIYPTTVYGFRQESVIYDHATTTATFKNFMGGTSDIVIKFVKRDGGKEIDEVDARYNAELISGFGEGVNNSGYVFYPVTGMTGKDVIITDNGVNTIKLSDITMADGYSTTLSNVGDGKFEIRLYLGASSQGWVDGAWGASPAMAAFFTYTTGVTVDGEQAGIENIVAFLTMTENAPVEYTTSAVSASTNLLPVSL